MSLHRVLNENKKCVYKLSVLKTMNPKGSGTSAQSEPLLHLQVNFEVNVSQFSRLELNSSVSTTFKEPV